MAGYGRAVAVLGAVHMLGASAAAAQVLNSGEYSSSPDRGYVASTVQSAEFDIALSRIAADSCASPGVRALATQIGADQTQAEKATQAAAAQDDASPNRVPVLSGFQSGLLAKLRQAPADKCASVYLETEQDSLRQSQELQQGYARQGAAPTLRGVAARNAGQARTHLTALQTLEP